MSNRFQDSEVLMGELKKGSLEAFAQFYERYVPLVFQIAMRMLEDQMEAEDLCHDIFLEAYRTAGQYNSQRGSVEAWLAVKTRTRCLDRLRRKKVELFGEVNEPRMVRDEAPPSTEEKVLAKWEREKVREALLKIPKSQRQAVYGMYYLAKTHRELAERMERPLGTVKSLVRYGLGNLRKQLEQLDWLGSAKGAKERE